MGWIIYLLAFVFSWLFIYFVCFVLLIYSDNLAHIIGVEFIDALENLSECSQEVKRQILNPVLELTCKELSKLFK
jgi:hypothetical protein